MKTKYLITMIAMFLLLATFVIAQAMTSYEVLVDEKTNEYIIRKASDDKITTQEAATRLLKEQVAESIREDNKIRFEKAIMKIRADDAKLAQAVPILEGIVSQ